MFLYNYETGESKIINFDNDPGNVDYVSLSLNEDKFVIASYSKVSGSYSFEFWIANIDGTKSKKLETDISIHSFKPQFALNDSVILYKTLKDKNQYVIESFDLKTIKTKVVFYNGKAKILNFLVSPDGKKIVVHTFSKMEIIDLTNEKNKFGDNIDIKIHELLKWSKDGSEVFYKDSENNLWKLKLNPKNGENACEQVKDKTGNPIRLRLKTEKIPETFASGKKSS